ncbi:exported hypothetical protein [Nitrospina gracilis 3/211]|uniref:Uncharacterized protein n=1 Tax=Nitrospina gracilis (strain 3/211) TaxID=1266370 RepID=M1YMU8_NITG3|nr:MULTISPECIES: hypothetical protein [Nitrospina]MCF8724619.1 Flp pilus assembly protein TadD [Nitrospina sp. Nb-3]CCQ91801.1 exported hypothetical protein [Nitrospina gracilis 3/211]
MRKLLVSLVIAFVMMIPFSAMADEGPMKLPDSAPESAKMHNQEGIKHWNQGHYDVAFKHFEESAGIDASNGEIHFNEAIALDKMGQHGKATMHFKAAKSRANGNQAIINSPILNAHIGG